MPCVAHSHRSHFTKAILVMIFTGIATFFSITWWTSQVQAAGNVDLVAELHVDSTSAVGRPFQATLVVTNAGTTEARNTAVRFEASAGTTNLVGAWQAATSGASGTWDGITTSASTASPMWLEGIIASIPAGGSVTLTVTGNHPSASTNALVLTVTPGDGEADADPSTNTVRQNVALETKAAVTVSKTQDLETVGSGQTRTYTITITNNGPADLINAEINDSYYYSGDAGATITHATTCDPASTAPCPTWANGQQQTTTVPYGLTIFSRNRNKITVHAGQTLILKVPITQTTPACGTTINGYNTFTLYSPTGTNFTTPQGQTTTQLSSSIYGKNTRVDLASATRLVVPGTQTTASQPNTPADLGVDVANGCGTATDVDVSVRIPTAGFSADPLARVTCTATGGAVCPDPAELRWDAVAGTITGTIPTIPTGGKVSLGLSGQTGYLPPTTASYIIETTVETTGDVNPASNPSSVSFGYSSATTTMTLVHTIEGLPPSGAPGDIVFDGIARCGGLQPIPLTITIPKGSTNQMQLASDKVFIGSSCTLEVTRPQAPNGYRWVDQDPTPTGDTRYSWTPAAPGAVDISETRVTGPLVYRFLWKLERDPDLLVVPALPLTGGQSETTFLLTGAALAGAAGATAGVRAIRRRREQH